MWVCLALSLLNLCLSSGFPGLLGKECKEKSEGHRELTGREHRTPVFLACNMQKNQKLNTDDKLLTPLSPGVGRKALKQVTWDSSRL